MLDRTTPGRPPSWTAQRIERLNFLWKQGDSASEIAGKLGVTRNAVLGKLHRLNAPPAANAILKWTDEEETQLRTMWPSDMATSLIAKHFEVTPQAIYNKAYKLGLSSRKRGVKIAAPRRKPVPRAERVVPFLDSEIPLDQRRSLLELRRGDCRYPVGDPGTPDFFFCGGRVKDGQSYCPYHYHVTHSGKSYPKPFIHQNWRRT